MADMFPDEGLDVILGVFPRGGTTPSNLYVGMFTSSAGASAVPAASATISAMGAGYAECSTSAGQYTTYARQAIASTTSGWGAPGAVSPWGITGRGSVGTQVSFPAPTAAYAPTNPICGFFIADAITSGHAVYYSNFSDTTSIASLAIGDVVKVTPTFGYGN